MPLYHVHASYIKQGSHQGGASGFARYLSREGREEASQFHRYLERENGQGKDDLVAAGHANLPRWAQGSAERFWQMADQYERPGWIVARHLQVALPRELSPDARLELAHDICEATVGRFPHSWAIHEPQARDGSGAQPHIHILFSPRREDVELDRAPAQWFAKAAAQGQDPLRGGVRKDVHIERKAWLYDVRSAVALMTNCALARAGIEAAVDHRSLEARGLSRDPARYASTHDKADLDRTMTYRQHLRDSGTLAYEQIATYGQWQDQRPHLFSIERQAVLDMARDHLWRYDRSPARVLEREHSLARTLDRAMQERTPIIGHERPVPQIQRQPRLERPLRELAAMLGPGDEEPQGGVAVRFRLFDREEERERSQGYGLGF